MLALRGDVVMNAMRCVRRIQLKILWPIVVAHTVDVMRDLVAREHPADFCREHDPMFQRVPVLVCHRMIAPDLDPDVSAVVSGAPAFPRITSFFRAVRPLPVTVTTATTELMFHGAKLIRFALDYLSAVFTGNRNRGVGRHRTNYNAAIHSQSGVTSQIWNESELAAARAFYQGVSR